MDSPIEQNIVDVKRAKRTFSRIGFALLAFFGAAYAAVFVLELVLQLFFRMTPEEILQPITAMVISSVAMYGVGFPVFVLVLLPAKPVPRTAGKVPLSTVAVLTLIAFFLMYIGNFVGIFASGLFENFFHFALEESTLELIGSLPWYVVFVFAVVIGPLVEECIFRKWILDRTRVYGEKLAILFSALTFALFHMSIQQFFYAFLIGLVLGYLYVRSGNLLSVWLIHALLNFFGSVVPLLLMQYCNYTELLESVMESPDAMLAQMTENPIAFGAVLLYSMVNMAMIVLGAILFFRNRRKVYFESAEQALPRDSEATVAFTGIGVILFIALCVVFPIATHFLTQMLQNL